MSPARGLSLQARFLLAPLIGATLAGLLVVLLIQGVDRLGERSRAVEIEDVSRLRGLTSLSTRLARNHAALYELLIGVEEGADEEQLFEQLRPLMFELHRIAGELRTDSSALEASVETLARTLAQVDRYREVATNGALSSAVSRTTAAEQMRLATAHFNAALTGLLELQSEIGRRHAEQTAVLDAQVRSAQLRFALVGGLILALTVGVAIALARRMTRDLGGLIDVLGQLAAGRTDVHIPRTAAPDELGAMARGLEAFRDSQHSLRLRERAIESAPFGIAFAACTEPDFPIVHANQTLASMLRIERDKLLGRPLSELLGPAPDPHDAAPLHAALAARRRLGLSAPVQRADGSRFEAELRVAPAIENDGEPTHLVAVLSDLSTTRSLERQLRESQKMEAVGRVAGGVAHDFNNYLTVILGYSSELLRDFPEGDPGRAPIEAIREAAQRSAKLTRQLLAFSRRQPVEPRVLDLNAILRDMDTLLRRTLGEQVRLETVRAAGLGRVRADPAQLEQVVVNLAVNARDAMGDGGTLTLETANVHLDREYTARHPEVEPGRYVMLAVSDSGCGMRPEVRERIFEPFFTTKPVGQGTGLGLSTVYGIVQQAGGSIDVYSEPGQGTTVKVYLPRVEGHADREPARRTEAEATGSGRILVVEDNEMVRSLTSRMLRHAGYTVIEAPDASAALRLVDSLEPPPDLLLTDVVMPEMSGTELAERLRGHWPELPVLFMSGFTENGAVQRGVLASGTGLLNKPFTRVDLLERVRERLEA